MLVSHLKNLLFEFSKTRCLPSQFALYRPKTLKFRSFFVLQDCPFMDTFYTTNTIPFPTRMVLLLPITVDICSTNVVSIYNRDKLNFKQIICRRQTRACLSEVSMTSTKLLYLENKGLDFLLLVTNLLNTFRIQV